MNKTDEKIKQLQIDTVLRNFDFHTVHKVMELLDWTWYHEDGEVKIPTIDTLRQESERLLKNVFILDKAPWIESGGLRASREDGILSLIFIVEESEL